MAISSPGRAGRRNRAKGLHVSGGSGPPEPGLAGRAGAPVWGADLRRDYCCGAGIVGAAAGAAGAVEAAAGATGISRES